MGNSDSIYIDEMRDRIDNKELSLAEKAKNMVPHLIAQSAANESAARILPETLEPLRDAGLLHFWVPSCFGGGEASLNEAREVIETLAYADGSTGWAIMANQVATASAAAFLKPAAAKAVFGGDRLAVIAGQGAPIGKAEVMDNGYRLSGNWQYGSGILHADWVHTGAMALKNGVPVCVPGTERPEARIFILPVSDVTLMANWDVIGLRATGSVDYSARDAFVPEEFTHPAATTEPCQGGDAYRIGLTGMAQIGHTSFVLGLAKRCLKEIAELAGAERRPANIGQQHGDEAFQEQFGFHSAKLLAARAAQVAWCDEVSHTISSGNPPTVRQVSEGILILYNAHHVSYDIARFAYLHGGGTSLRAGWLQRLYRDMSAAMQHIVTSPSRLRTAAQEIMGLHPGKVWSLSQLVNT